MKKLRQGQTIYVVHLDISRAFTEWYVREIFLQSHKEQLPPRGCIVTHVPVTYAAVLIKRYETRVFTSRRKAERACKLRNKGVAGIYI